MTLAEQRDRVQFPVPPLCLYSYLMSPFAARVHAVLRHKRLSFDIRYVNPTRVRQELPIGSAIPVLSIGQQSLVDSIVIIQRLELLFPAIPVYTGNREVDARIDRFVLWMDQSLVAYQFASILARPGRDFFACLRRGWRLGQLMHRTAPAGLRYALQVGWPAVLWSQGFVRRFAKMAEQKGGCATLSSELRDRFACELGAGPCIFEQSRPTLADLVCYATIAPPHLTGVLQQPFGDSAQVRAWLVVMHDHLAGNPPLVPIHCRHRAFMPD